LNCLHRNRLHFYSYNVNRLFIAGSITAKKYKSIADRMSQRIITVLVLIVVAYFIYTYLTDSSTNEAYVALAPAPLITRAEPLPAMKIAAAGPNPPAQETGSATAKVQSETMSDDPYFENAGDSDMAENITHPENFYGPGIVPESSALAVEGGTASYRSAPGPSDGQIFTPEQVANGGVYYDDVTPMESMPGLSYSVY